MNGQKIPADLVETMNLMEGLLKDLEQPARELDEATFVRVFLPLLTSKEDNVDLRAWVAVAGGPNNRVAIYRMNGSKKEVLYVVPPLINLNGFTKTDYAHQNSVWERMQTAMRKIRNAPMRDRQIYQEEMSQVDIDGVKIPLSDAVQWNRILEMNGIDTGIVPAVGDEGVKHDKNKIETEGWEDF